MIQEEFKEVEANSGLDVTGSRNNMKTVYLHSVS